MIRVDTGAIERSAMRLKRAAKSKPLQGLALTAAAYLAEGATERTPVDTGRLRAGWSAAETGAHTAEVCNPVEYASFVEFDTRHWISRQIVPGQKFMHRAKDETAEALPEKIAERVREVIGRCFE
ncbi:MAG: HK97 gp10 family phage protein [Oscillospiraceae bacterium]|nr:HK97 gp10 family phage protein [Oscillospiraceae bacterium]